MATTSAKAAYSAAHAMGEIKRMALESFIVFYRVETLRGEKYGNNTFMALEDC
jgi:hypothetical protein